ncbi:hypothetical protein [Streptomyces sporangiiformans]|uniref:hypothetical protein n=1 Tax=Streptomyces sporangiiformans TaxID=2315329 RepID=UPI0013C52859|nr:hypothetical protein [Streptomyces sporangiiformans]
MTTNGSSPSEALAKDDVSQDGRPIVELRGAGKSYGNVRAPSPRTTCPRTAGRS